MSKCASRLWRRCCNIWDARRRCANKPPATPERSPPTPYGRIYSQTTNRHTTKHYRRATCDMSPSSSRPPTCRSSPSRPLRSNPRGNGSPSNRTCPPTWRSWRPWPTTSGGAGTTKPATSSSRSPARNAGKSSTRTPSTCCRCFRLTCSTPSVTMLISWRNWTRYMLISNNIWQKRARERRRRWPISAWNSASATS